jgi:hypothetical protein
MDVWHKFATSCDSKYTILEFVNSSFENRSNNFTLNYGYELFIHIDMICLSYSYCVHLSSNFKNYLCVPVDECLFF